MTTNVISLVETIRMQNRLFSAIVSIRNRNHFKVTLSGKYSKTLAITTPGGLDTLKDLLDDVYDELANRNLAGEIIKTVGGK